ncbi:Rne/Rng family ribonuclease [Aquisediminimonas sediminicola]|uniref:Rne/Rng family ribonuclease n=1 Tax=Alteraquisediminimonas sediminicola TaxID=2676787 RepID=UPI001FECC2D4|nr:ribonuclease E/G [Aquisediminimonas sediminicola]
MPIQMLIDARHREETRVAVVKGNRIEEFDFESAERKQLKGNIYLAKVTRVEPSLQAAFVDYGGNRHGFLAFSEIHPDYYQIPKEDREALLREEAEYAAEEDALRAEHGDLEPIDGHHDDDGHDDDRPEAQAESQSADHDNGEQGEEDRPPAAMQLGRDDESPAENLRQRRMSLRRRYKIQDVIRRRQVLLVQVVKEERGNKGAALTTYLSLAGRYCVLMPNTSHGGGISRKISSAADRKRLKAIMADLNLPSTMGCIVRTAGLQRTKTEIKRDFDYLARLWDEIRDNTLKSQAPALVYGDNDLIKRAIRDIYNRDIDSVIVEGEEGYKAARAYMKLLMPSHVRRITGYADPVPLFQRYGVENQLAAMYSPTVQLKSGGYLVINPTEALVSIDINSGRSTREHNIEQTALSTNLEAADEIARQLRLRDMAGLVVIDFIDMENHSSVRKVEKAMKAALANDRARIQVGRISSFGLMEMSRQRLRTGVLEASTKPCPHCEGSGLMRTASSSGLSALRLLEEEAARGRGSQLVLRVGQEAGIYILNKKRAELAEIEVTYGVTIEVLIEVSLEGARMAVESFGPPPAHAPLIHAIVPIEDDDFVYDEEEEEEEVEEAAADARSEGRGEGRSEARGEEGEGRKRRRRNRRGRRGRREDGGVEDENGQEAARAEGFADEGEDEEGEDRAEGQSAEERAGEERSAEGGENGTRRRRNRRGRRGNRNRDQSAVAAEVSAEAGETGAEVAEVAVAVEAAEPVAEVEAAGEEKPKARRRPRARKAEAGAEAVAETAAAKPVKAPAKTRAKVAPKAKAEVAEVVVEATTPAAEPVVVEAEAAAKPARKPRARKPKAEATVEAASEAEAAPVAVDAEVAASDEKPKRKRVSRAKASATAVPADTTVSAEPAVSADDADGQDSNENPRKGWWQRTFGA